MYITPQEPPFDLFQPVAPATGTNDAASTVPSSPAYGAPKAPDQILRFTAPWNGAANDGGGADAQYGASQSPLLGMLTSLLTQLGQLLQQFGGGFGFGQNGNSGCGGGPCGQPLGPQQYFQSANGQSIGDPHLSFNGQHWNDQQSQGHLLDSNSFQGGYNISTQTTAPNEKGVSVNQSATVTTDGGGTQVTLDDRGNATVSQNGQQFALSDGQSYTLGNGETVSRASDGAVTVSDTNASGGSITTTLSNGNNDVDVSVQAGNVNLGGALVNGAAQEPGAPVAGPPPIAEPPWIPQQPQMPVAPGTPFPWRLYAQTGPAQI